MHPDVLRFLFELQRIKEKCIHCGSTDTTTGVHVDNNGGYAVYEKYTCNRCKTEFLEKDIFRE